MAEHVLFVDDEENILNALRRLLADEEFEVLTATSGEAGLEILRNTPEMAVIVSDQRMPQMSGVEFLAQARETVPAALRIMLTGYADLQATMDAINRGGTCRYITKPWQDHELVQTIRDAVAQYRLMNENQRLTHIVQKQNEDLQEWNNNLKSRVLEQTTAIRKQNDDLRGLTCRLKGNYKHFIEAYVALLELRNREVRNHSINVSNLAVTIAGKIGFSGENTESIRVAALLHDLGKITFPDRILQMRPEELRDGDLQAYQQHPVRGQMAIDLVEDLQEAGELVRHHHERFDGQGFPERLKGDAIPLGARIITLADYVDNQQQRAPQPLKNGELLEKVKVGAKRMFDPDLLPVLEQVLKDSADKKAAPELKELVLEPNELRANMLLSKDVISGTGLLLLKQGTVIDDSNITALRRYNMLDPFPEGVHVITGDEP